MAIELRTQFLQPARSKYQHRVHCWRGCSTCYVRKALYTHTGSTHNTDERTCSWRARLLTVSTVRRGRKALSKFPVMRLRCYLQQTSRWVVDELRHANNTHYFFAPSTKLSTTTSGDKGNALHGMKIVGPHLAGAPRIRRAYSETQAIFWHFRARELRLISLQQT